MAVSCKLHFSEPDPFPPLLNLRACGAFYRDVFQDGHCLARIKVAAEMRELIDKARNQTPAKPSARPMPLAQPKGELSELLTAQYPQQHLAGMVVSKAVEQRLQRVLKEQKHHKTLAGHGLEPRPKLLLVGPPGTGKTLTASVLATELRLPLFVARFDSLITNSWAKAPRSFA